MSLYEVVRLVVWVVGVPIIIFLVVQMIRKLRAISELDARLKAEREAQRSKNPYAELAEVMEAQELLKKAKDGGREK